MRNRLATQKIMQFARITLIEANDKLQKSKTKIRPEKPKCKGDIVTEGDLIVQNYIYNSIRRNYPEHGIISEEKLTENTGAEFVWVLDPIDGTKYFSKGIPLYALSLALKHNDQLVLGVVYSPKLQQLFCAEIGKGSRLNNKAIHCSPKKHLDQINICVEIPSRISPSFERRWALDKLNILVEQVNRVRIIGVSSLGLCWSAMGGFDAYVNLGSASKQWDIAAGEIIFKEANGKFCDTDGKIVAASSPVFEGLLKLLDLSS